MQDGWSFNRLLGTVLLTVRLMIDPNNRRWLLCTSTVAHQRAAPLHRVTCSFIMNMTAVALGQSALIHIPAAVNTNHSSGAAPGVPLCQVQGNHAAQPHSSCF